MRCRLVLACSEPIVNGLREGTQLNKFINEQLNDILINRLGLT